MNNHSIKIGCEIIIKKNNHILFGKRKNCYGEGTWGLPGGHLEYGETILQAAKRELLEELSITGIGFKLIAITENIDYHHYIHATFFIENFLGTIQCKEPNLCYEWKFFNINKLPENIFLPHKKILKTYFKNSLYLDNE